MASGTRTVFFTRFTFDRMLGNQPAHICIFATANTDRVGGGGSNALNVRCRPGWTLTAEWVVAAKTTFCEPVR